MRFSVAQLCLMQRLSMTRWAWRDKKFNFHIEGSFDANCMHFIHVKALKDNSYSWSYCPWWPSQEDMDAEDWYRAEILFI